MNELPTSSLSIQYVAMADTPHVEPHNKPVIIIKYHLKMLLL